MFSSVDMSSPWPTIDLDKYSVCNKKSSLFWCHVLSQVGLRFFMFGKCNYFPSVCVYNYIIKISGVFTDEHETIEDK